ncbi:tryptophan halogenase [Porphyrobacter algicida]|uniref:Tryptophan halogenase n=1 Tax=Qipengyuania algicida TaxID=1836209 RepID=A0A845AIX0_9SPHN|nr:tryptophan halogenase family protein [Qipengyuania algicida]MXP29554.1 tryptophan halogenase [Qipengyuania algicida]
MVPIKRILIAGGGSSGWMTAALLSKLFQGLYEIVLVESDAIGTIGVGEATIPAIKKYNELLGLDENAFMASTQASFKMGIQFVDWWRKGESYIHGFGVIGQNLEWLGCHQYWLKARATGHVRYFADYSINTAAALQNKFLRAQTQMGESPLSHIVHAFHFDASLFARFLSNFAQQRGVHRREGRIVDVNLRSDGYIESVTLEDGETVAADLFIDCSGFRSLLLGQALSVPFDDWSHWLPCDRAIAVPSDRAVNFTPYTRATAHGAGWQWRIPLQHRTGNGLVYSSRHIADEDAENLLLSNLDSAPRTDPRRIAFKAGKRKELWRKNCIAIGLAGGFLEPLESTSLHLVQSAIIRLVKLLPDRNFDPATIAEFNRQSDFEYERIRDFIVLHYAATQRNDTEFWNYCRTMDLPDTLQRKIDLWMGNGRIFREDDELFAEESWIQVFIGQGLIPRGYDPMVDMKKDDDVTRYLDDIAMVIGKCVNVMPTHEDYVAKTCPAPAP